MNRSSFNRDPEDLPLSTLELAQRVTAGPAGSASSGGSLGPGFDHPSTRFPPELAEHVGFQWQRSAPANSSGARLNESSRTVRGVSFNRDPEDLPLSTLELFQRVKAGPAGSASSGGSLGPGFDHPSTRFPPELAERVGFQRQQFAPANSSGARLNERGVLNARQNTAIRLAGVAMLLLGIVTAGNAAPTTADSERSSHFEDVIFLTDRPILIRFHLQVDGQPWNETRDRLARRQFDRLDRDRDGFVSPEQLASLPLPELDPDAIANWDVSQDGKLSADEFLSLFSATSGPSFLLAEGASRATRSVRLFARLDADEDRRLTPAEFDRARATLSKLDFDDDETVSTTELAPFRNPLLGQVVTASDQPVGLDVPFVAARNFPSPASLAELLLRRYRSTSAASSEDAPPVEHLSCTLAAWSASGGDSAKYDRDSNGRLSHAELTELLSHWDPELEVLVELPGSKPSRPQLSILADRTETKARSSRRPSDRLGLELQKARFDLRAQSSRAASSDNLRFYLLQFRIADANKNNYLEPDEFPRLGIADAEFTSVDADGDGQVVRDELSDFLQRDAFASQIQIVMSVAADSETLFELMDVDYDQRLAIREFAALARRIRPLDANRDGNLDASEMSQQYRIVFSMGKPRIFQQQMAMQRNQNAPAPRATPAVDGPEWFRRMDRNQDGDLSWREFLGSREVFDRMDGDRDGLITAEETGVE